MVAVHAQSPKAAGRPAGAAASCGSRTAWAPARPGPAAAGAAHHPCIHVAWIAALLQDPLPDMQELVQAATWEGVC